MYVPFLGRLSVLEWPVVLVSFVLSWTEYTFSVITRCLPKTVINAFTLVLRLVYRFTLNVNFDADENDEALVRYHYIASSGVDKERYNLVSGIMNSRDITEMCALFGYDVENRIVRTEDNYLLTIQRITRKGAAPRNGKVVYMHHGLLMCSEIWVTMLEKNCNLPFVLHDLGYDVWLGNNRGNKYSLKHVYHLFTSEKFWDFSLDEFALFDIPNTIDYILRETEKKSLTYIGFSQGTAQAFASVLINSDLNRKIDRIIAISPATTPHGLHSKFLDILLKSSPYMLFLLFSRRVLMPSVLFWQRVMYPPFFDTSIDVANYMLFNWKALNIDRVQKFCSYAHLYSTTSVKTVVHWFQIMASKNFQMYHDDTTGFSSIRLTNYPIKSITVPVHLIYGDSDSLVDITVMKKQLPESTTTIHCVSDHEHLDNLWGRDVASTVFPSVLAALEERNGVAHGKLSA